MNNTEEKKEITEKEQAKEKTEVEKLQDEIKQKDATIGALKGMLGQMVPVVEVMLPLLKEQPQLDKKLLDQIERMTQISKMLMSMGDSNVSM